MTTQHLYHDGPFDLDPFDLMVSMRSPALDRPLEPGEDHHADALLASIFDTTGTDDLRRRQQWRRRWVSGVIVVAVAGGGAVAASRLLAEPTDSVALSCYSEASATPAIQVGLLIDPTSTPEAQCAPSWTTGPLGTSGPPELASCVTNTGITAVIPGTGETCTDIGYDERAPTAPGEQNIPAEITNAISDTWAAEDRCISDLAEARALVELIFDEVDATGWTITIAQPTTPELPCIGVGVDPEQRTVLFAALPDVG